MADSYIFRQTEMRDVEFGVTVDWRNKFLPRIIRYVAPPLSTYEDAVQNEQNILVGKIVLPGDYTVELYERPKDIIGDYGSVAILIHDGVIIDKYDVSSSLGNNSLSLSYAAILSANNNIMLILNYVGQPSEVPEGFVTIRISQSEAIVNALPLTIYGKLVVTEKNFDEIDLWSTELNKVNGTNSPTSYTVRRCRMKNKTYKCDPAKMQDRLFAPNEIINPGIEIRR
ncbi:hypothetical protein [Niveispirillum sp. KHB5.9]|uniref:hypothetical protein n=1 Tax=Niveispirillum sp. KHB5.9 TaxID=3400269 RepID=UPI003A89A744